MDVDAARMLIYLIPLLHVLLFFLAKIRTFTFNSCITFFFVNINVILHLADYYLWDIFMCENDY